MRLSRIEQQARTRALLLLAAREEFEERGFTAATLELISDRAGFSRTAVYKHFAGKDDIFLAVAEHEAAEQENLAERLLADETRPPVETLLEWFGLVGAEGQRLMRAKAEFVLTLGDDPALRDRVADTQQRVEDRTTEVIAELVRRAGILLQVSDAELASLVVAVANALWLRALVFPTFDADAAFREALATLLRGASRGVPAQPHVDHFVAVRRGTRPRKLRHRAPKGTSR